MAKKIGGVVGIGLTITNVLRQLTKFEPPASKNSMQSRRFLFTAWKKPLAIKAIMDSVGDIHCRLGGLSCGLGLTYWTSAVDWAINVGGKPFFSGPAFVPIMFELTILYVRSLLGGSLVCCLRMPKIDPAIIDPDLTCHKFAIFIPENDVNYDAGRAEQLLKQVGAKEVRRISEY